MIGKLIEILGAVKVYELLFMGFLSCFKLKAKEIIFVLIKYTVILIPSTRLTCLIVHLITSLSLSLSLNEILKKLIIFQCSLIFLNK